MRPLKRCEEAQAPSRGKRSHLRKGTAAINPRVLPGFSYIIGLIATKPQALLQNMAQAHYTKSDVKVR